MVFCFLTYRAPAEAENLSDESDHSVKDQSLSNGDSHDSVDGNMEFNISYSKVGQRRNENLSTGITHIAQLDSDSGYTFLVDKMSSLPKTDHEYQNLHPSNDDRLNIEYTGEMLRGRHLKKVMSYPANNTNNVLFFGEDVRAQKEFVRNGSLPKETFVTISDVSLRTRPSHLPPPTRPPPPALDVLKGDSGKVTSNCQNVVFEETAGDSSPPYFDVEVDASSSAAAMKEAMDKAQAKLKSAKESIERKRESLQNRVKSDTKKDRKDKEEKLTKIVNGLVSRRDEREQGISQIEENGMEFSVLEKQKVKKTTQPILDLLEGKKHRNGAKRSTEENHGRESSSSQGSDRIDVAGEWKEAAQFFELITDKSRKASDQENNENVLLHNSNFHERVEKEKKAIVKASQHPQKNDKKVKAVRADDELVDCEKKTEDPKEAVEQNRSSGRSVAANRQKGNDKKVQVAVEASKQEGNEKKFNMDLKPVETEKPQARLDDLQKHENYVEVQERESKIVARQTKKHKEKALWLKEDNKIMEDVKKFTRENGDSERRQRKVFVLEENDEKLNAPLEQAENDRRLKKVVHEQEENENINSEASEIEANGKRLREVLRREENERRLKEALEKKGNKRILKDTREKEERLRREREAVEWEENEKRHREAREREENEKRHRETREREENEKRQTEACEREENEKRQREAREREDNEKRHREAREREENEKRHKEAREREENEKRQREAGEREENEKRHREACEREENEKRQREAREREENEKRKREASEREEGEKRKRDAREREENEKRQREAREREENEKRQREAREREENEKRLREAHEREETENRQREAHEREETEKRIKEVLEKEENERRMKETVEKEERQRRQREAVEQEENAKRGREENEKRLKEAEKKENGRLKAVESEENERRQRDAHEKEESEKRCEETFEREEIEQEASGREVGRSLKEVREQQKNCMASRRAQEADGIEAALKVDNEPEDIGTTSQATCEWEETEAKHTDIGESGKEKALNNMAKDHSVMKQACELCDDKSLGATKLAGKNEGSSKKLDLTKEIAIEETSKIVDQLRNDEKKVVSGIAQGNLKQEKSQFLMEDSTDIEQNNIGKVRSNFQVDPVFGNQGKKFPYEKSDKGKHIEQSQVSLNPEISNVTFMSAKVVKESVDTARKIGGAQQIILEVKGSTQRTAQQVNATQSTERKVKNSYETLSSEDKEAERMKRERDLEMERLRKMEEEREREREREKDRMAVDKATLDTREGAYAEARERAERAAVERATAEARQRALNESRERLEKACAEAREKSLPEKASMEARLRAERAAVERATAEARERAFEKAMAERAASGARERVERSVSDKFSASSRSSGMRATSSSSDLQDLQSQGSGTFTGSRYQYSSVYSERFEGVEGESAQRYKARLERHQRTAERAAKALAEKNMRDLFAQREQAERNRLAETLDADVKRWSSGKEGNLRALLSTLQYILGPDSGWQPIPLTEVITAAAVKKAYRKATLCVHPDKLQQRGASIQQKYICEKVFDLLKEAWNKFNSEER
ncbi:auxilin-like protein 1 isoform X2 [Manihot esculenta]|uniref:Uncharacterized protein n=1 Tax=Manihot esculenta TaxID=3983 RepID=A0ACB7ICT9_MANES|nr:auxilin-like protein 1 isoform X2 [Manihot esculenta]KAG8662727.1 hypothetical protein MANES_01G137600v8 [Manihot esculenta]